MVHFASFFKVATILFASMILASPPSLLGEPSIQLKDISIRSPSPIGDRLTERKTLISIPV